MKSPYTPEEIESLHDVLDWVDQCITELEAELYNRLVIAHEIRRRTMAEITRQYRPADGPLADDELWKWALKKWSIRGKL